MDAIKVMLTVLMKAQSVTDFQCQSDFIVKVMQAAKVYGAYYELALKEWNSNVNFFMSDVSTTCKVEVDHKAHSLKIAYSKNSIEYDQYNPLTLKWFNEWDLTIKELRESKKQSKASAKEPAKELSKERV